MTKYFCDRCKKENKTNVPFKHVVWERWARVGIDHFEKELCDSCLEKLSKFMKM